MQGKGRIKGHVTNAAGEPVEDASVSVETGPGSAPDIAALTNEAGEFVLDGLVPGLWRLAAYGPNGLSGFSNAEVEDGFESQAQIRIY